jgi:hypothetical protein
MEQHLGWLGAALLAVVFPIGIFISRDNVRSRRQDIIEQLESLFKRDRKTETRDGGPMGQATSQEWEIVPSFEFVKSKYFKTSSPKYNGSFYQGTSDDRIAEQVARRKEPKRE